MGAQLPAGPPNLRVGITDPTSGWPCTTTAANLDTVYALAVADIERELGSISGIDAPSGHTAVSRCPGPKFRWANACSKVATSECKSTFTSRTWRRVAEWLAVARSTTSTQRRKAACWKLLYYHHPMPASTSIAWGEMVDFGVWNNAITMTQLGNEHVVRMLRDAAL